MLYDTIDDLESNAPRSYEAARQGSIMEGVFGLEESAKKSWKDVPDILTVYRGAKDGERLGEVVNGSLSESIASSFGKVKEFKVHKDDILWAYRGRMGHREKEVFFEKHAIIKPKTVFGKK